MRRRNLPRDYIEQHNRNLYSTDTLLLQTIQVPVRMYFSSDSRSAPAFIRIAITIRNAQLNFPSRRILAAELQLFYSPLAL